MKSIERTLYENYKSNMKFHKVEKPTLSYQEWIKDVFNKKLKV